jgi:hypothetical protein
MGVDEDGASASLAEPPRLERTVNWTSVVTAEPTSGVEAGTLLGSGRRASDFVGAGAIAVTRPGGRVEVRAACDGVPSLAADGVTVTRLHELEGNVDRAVGDRAVRGSLRIGGHIAPGREMSATGPVRVEGNIDRSEVRAGGELHIEGRAAGASLVGGSLSALRRQLHAPLGGVAEEIDALLEMAGLLLSAESWRGLPSPTRVIRVLCAERFDTLESRLALGQSLIASARRSWPGLCGDLATQVAAAHRAVATPEESDDPLAQLNTAAAFLAAAIPPRRATTDVGIRVGSAQGCSLETAGPLRLTAAGVSDCEINVGGDLIAMGPGGVVRGGAARVGGRVRVRELAGREGSRLRVVIEDTRPSEDVLRADVVNAGVEIAVGGEVVRFERRRTDVRVGVSGGRPVLATA